jgi:prevent-host-death family protein
MIRANIHELKAKLSKYVEMVEAGETILLCKRNLPVARICPLEESETQVPVLGSAIGEGHVLPAFYEPLTEEELGLWEGGPRGGSK